MCVWFAAADELDRNECDGTNGRKNKKAKKFKKSERTSVQKRSAEERRRRRRKRQDKDNGIKGGRRGKVKKSAKKNCVRADNGKERLWLREGREGRKGTVRRGTQWYGPGTARRGCAPQPMDGASTCGPGTPDTCETIPASRKRLRPSPFR